MKKMYETPALTIYQVEPVQVIAESMIVGGEAGVGEDGEADQVKSSYWDF